MIDLTTETASDFLSYAVPFFLLSFLAYEALNGKLKDGKKTKEDWWMSAICSLALPLVQRPLVMISVFVGLNFVFPEHAGEFRWVEQAYFWPCFVLFLMVDEFLHGGTHKFSHSRTPNNKTLQVIQAFLKVSHRPHHLNGGNDNKGELNVTHTYVEHWAWLIILPNYWFGLALLYFGFYETFLWGTLLKSVWALHVHTNWNYDLYLLNHPNPIIRKTMFALCHVFTFPTMHHQHHSRSKNSAKNMQNFLSLWDWLLWDTLVIEKSRPEIYGWRQTEKEANNVWFRFFNNNIDKA